MQFVYLPILDPILSIAICLWVIYNAIKNLKNTFKVFLQEAPLDVETDKLKQEVLNLNKVISLHDFHLWSLDGQRHILSMHIVREDNLSQEEIISLKCQIKEICSNYNINHATLEMETKSEEESCIHC
jgi:cobalt-zinc-cadmium efflux system protein